MDVSLLIRLIDQVSGPAVKIAKGLRNIGDVASDMKSGFGQAIREGFNVENIEQATKNAEAALQKARGRLVGAVGMAIAVAAPVLKAADFEQAFIDFANVAEIPVTRMAEIEARLIAATRTTGKNKSELLAILSTYVGKGMGLDDSIAAIEATARASTATKAEVADMTNAGFAAMDNLKVSAADLAKAFDVMAASGKQGSFELKDMARHFPELTAAASALEMKGVPAVASLSAALQIAMKSAGSADQAANNMSNFLGKITSGDTVKNFKKMGIDIEKELAAATKNGSDPLLRMLELIDKATDGGDQFKMSKLFADKQEKDFLRALIPNLKEFQRIRDEVANSEGVIDRDWINVTAGFKEEIKGLTTEVDNLFSSAGALLPIFKSAVQWMKDALRSVNEWTAANREMTEYIVKGVGGLLAFNVAGRLLAFGFAALRLPLIGIAAAFVKFDKNGRNVAVGWRLMRGAASALGSAADVAGRGIGSLVNRVGGLRNAFRAGVAAGWVIPLAFEFIDDMGRTPEERLEQLRNRQEAFKDFEKQVDETGFGRKWRELQAKTNELMGLDEGEVPAEAFARWLGKGWGTVERVWAEKTAAIREMAASLGAQLLAGLASGWEAVEAWGSQQAVWFQQIGGEAMASLKNGIMAGWGLIEAWISEKFEWIKGKLTFDLTINWPEPPEWLNWLIERSSTAAKGAKGLISAGSDWLSDFWNGDGERPGAGGRVQQFAGDVSGAGTATLPAEGFIGGVQSTFQSLFGDASSAGDDIARGGQAAKEGGELAGSALQRGAAALDAAFGRLPSIIAASVKGATANSGGGGGVSKAISDFRTSTFTGGTD